MDIKYFDGITPRQLDRIVEKFCKQINYSAKPQYIGVIPWEKSKINDCVNNVKEYLKNNEGSSVIGWAIWLHPHCMIEAEFHILYKSLNGQLIDITPHKNNIDKILFMEDQSIKYNDCQINNIRKNISKSKLIDSVIANWNEIFVIQNEGKNKYKHGEIIIEGEKAERMMYLEYLNQQLLANFFSTLKLKPNDTCICGSGLNFINCCKLILVKTN